MSDDRTLHERLLSYRPRNEWGDGERHDICDEAAEYIAKLEKERDEAKALVVEANNSLYGSQGYFHSLNGGAFDKYHLATGIEDLKATSRLAHTSQARLSEAVKVLEWVNAELKDHGYAEIGTLRATVINAIEAAKS